MHVITLDELCEPFFELACRIRRESRLVEAEAQRRRRDEHFRRVLEEDDTPSLRADADDGAAAEGDLDERRADRASTDPASDAGTAAPVDAELRTIDDLRDLVGATFARADEQAKQAPELLADWKDVRPALAGLIDEVTVDSSLSFADAWRRDRWADRIKRPDVAVRFYRMVEDDLAGYGQGVTDRLRVALVCLELGFEGCHRDDRTQVQAYVARIRERLQRSEAALDHVGAGSLAPSCRVFDPSGGPAVEQWRWLAVGAAVLLVVSIGLTFGAYRLATGALEQTLRGVADGTTSAVDASPDG